MKNMYLKRTLYENIIFGHETMTHLLLLYHPNIIYEN